jgi:hypothetical protein
MMHQTAAMDGPPFVQGLFESIEDEARMCGPAHPPADNPTGIGIDDVAPKFYPVLSSFPAVVLPCWAGEAAGACAEPLA